jgi:GH18 family chitinase
LDGVDIDWEGRTTPQHTASMLLLVGELRAALARNFASKRYVLSVAVHPGDVSVLDIARDVNVDRVMLMAYDWCRTLPCRHAAYKPSIEALEQLIAAGAPPLKLLLGLPAYGRHMQTPGIENNIEIYMCATE